MYLRNVTSEDVKLRSFKGFKFSFPPGTFWVWDEAGEELLKTYTPIGQNGTWSYSGDQRVLNPVAGVTPPIVASTEEAWEHDGRKLAQVERFIVNYEHIPDRDKLIGIARERGVPDSKVNEWISSKDIDRSEIARTINKLPVPESVRFPAKLEQEATKVT